MHIEKRKLWSKGRKKCTMTIFNLCKTHYSFGVFFLPLFLPVQLLLGCLLYDCNFSQFIKKKSCDIKKSIWISIIIYTAFQWFLFRFMHLVYFYLNPTLRARCKKKAFGFILNRIVSLKQNCVKTFRYFYTSIARGYWVTPKIPRGLVKDFLQIKITVKKN